MEMVVIPVAAEWAMVMMGREAVMVVAMVMMGMVAVLVVVMVSAFMQVPEGMTRDPADEAAREQASCQKGKCHLT